MATAVLPAPAPLTSSVGLLAMLEESETQIKVHALQKLERVVPDFWAEISESLPDIEALYEDEAFPQRRLAALVASKVYYYLGEYADALVFALGAETLFNVDEGSEYVDTLLAKAIDEYCKQHQQRYEAATGSQEESGSSAAAEAPIDRRLIDLVDRMVESSLERRAYQMVMGLALEARRTDLIERIILLCDAKPGELEHDASTIKMLEYCFGLFSSAVVPRSFRATLIALLVTIYRGLPAPEYLGLARCLAQAGDAAGVAAILSQLVESESAEARLAAFQISFDLVDNCTQAFLKLVAERTKAKPPPPAAAEPSAAEGAAEGEAAAAAPPPAEVVEPAASKAHANLQLILSGEASIGLSLEFLVRSNKTDTLILTGMKKAADQRNSLCHSAIVLAHSLMNAGTTADSFLRDNLEWLSRATNWAKFSATATLGVIHRGHVKQALSLLAPYLPQAGMSASPYSEGGALFALGIIHANHGHSIRAYLLDALRSAGTNEVVQHGCALGIGISMMGSEDEDLYEELKGVLFNDSAVAGEAAALAMGLLMLGSASPKAIEEMLGYAHDTAHEKIMYGLAVNSVSSHLQL